MNLPEIAIIILHYKNLDHTRECLRSVKNIQYPNFSVFVVNNDKPYDAQILHREFGNFITLIQNSHNLGFSEGNNVGIGAALADKTNDAVLLLNNDTIVDPNILRELALSGADMTAPRMMQYHDRAEVDNLGIQLMSSGLPFNRRHARDKLFCPSGGAALYTRKLLEAVSPAFTKSLSRVCRGKGVGGWLGPRFYAYAEDLDLGFRARLMGFKADYTPNAIVYHKGSAATAPMSDFAVYQTYRNLIWTQYKNFPALLLLWQSPWLALGWIFILALYIKKGRAKIILRAFWDGIKGLSAITKERQTLQRQRQATQKEILSWFAPGLFPRSYL